jgi:hypothetical protein
MVPKSITGDVLSYLEDWRLQRRRQKSSVAAQDKLLIEVHMLQTVEKFGRLFRPPFLVDDS